MMRRLVDVRIEVNDVESRMEIDDGGKYYMPKEEAAQSDATNADNC